MSEDKNRTLGSSTIASALTEAQSIVAEAQKRARELTAEAKRNYETASQRGYSEGYQRGQKDAVEQAVRLIEAGASLSDSLAEQAAKLALAISKIVISEELFINPQAAKQIALHAIQESVIGEMVTIIVNPEDEKAVSDGLPEIRKVAGGAVVAIESDSSLARGGCLIRTDFGEVDASVQTLLASIAERLGVDWHG